MRVAWRLGVSSAMGRIVVFLSAPRPAALLLTIAATIGLAHAAWIVWPDPGLGFLTGAADVWAFPQGIIRNSQNDTAQVMVAHLTIAQTPWAWPLFHVPSLMPPDGVNLFWLDPVPWLLLLSRALAGPGEPVLNMLGPFLFACLALNAVGMTALLVALGRRSLGAAIAGSILASCAPWFLFRWGHPALMAQVLLLLALALYSASHRRGHDLRLTAAWWGLVVITALTHAYLALMVIAIHAATWLHLWRSRRARRNQLILDGLALMSAPITAVIVLGLRRSAVIQASTSDYGLYALDLLSPVLPQMSGLVPGAAQLILPAYEGYAWFGVGGLFLLIAALPAFLRWAPRGVPAHGALLLAVAVLVAIAVSHRLQVGGHIVAVAPLPDTLAALLGVVRSAGRFVWVLLYAALAGAVALIVGRYKPWIALALLAIGCGLQLADTAPLRAAIRDSIRAAGPAGIDRAAGARLLSGAKLLTIRPSYGCLWDEAARQAASPASVLPQLRAAMEYQLLAARAGIPTNSVSSGRTLVDCDAERAGWTRPPGEGEIAIVLPLAGLPPECAGAQGYAVCKGHPRN